MAAGVAAFGGAVVPGVAAGDEAVVDDAAGVEAQCSLWISMLLSIMALRDFSMALAVPDAGADELAAGPSDATGLSRLA